MIVRRSNSVTLDCSLKLTIHTYWSRTFFSVLDDNTLGNHLYISLGDFFFFDALLHDRVHDGISERNRALNPQEVVKGVTVTKLHLKLLPDVPESSLVLLRVAELAQVRVDATSSLHFIQLALKLGKSESNLDK